MKVVALVSGGKDSCYVMMKCLQYGHEIVALANLLPADDALDELNSYMYQTVGHQIVVSYAKCMGLPLFRRRIQGSTRNHGLSYSITPGDEVEDLYILLNEVKRQIPAVTAVSSGAIASDYQRLRVESVCSRLGLVSLSYLWKQDQTLLLREMIQNGIVAVTVKVAVMGLDPEKHLGRELSTLDAHLHKLNELYGVNVCGEGGEYETLTLDCPLFKNARIVLDEYQVILHSTSSIAPIGVLHPLAFHLEQKLSSGEIQENDTGLICEVLGDDSAQSCESMSVLKYESSTLVKADNLNIQISKTKKDDTFSLSCWLQNSSNGSAVLQADLEYVLEKIELDLAEYGYSWEHVLYIHLYIADMSKFSVANETYVRFITHDKCRFGVPSRSTVELPLSEVGLGSAYIEVLVAGDTTKKVLHVQSISCWAPSCIGPYSQATLHKDILYMAGQLGLDPPTMLLCPKGATFELEQALENCQAVAECFNCSINASALLFVMYCSKSLCAYDRIAIEERANLFLKEMKMKDSGKSLSALLDPMFLYILVTDLPKSALVEVKPILFVPGNVETSDKAPVNSPTMKSCWGFKHENWHNECLQKCIVPGRLVGAVISVSQTHAMKICSSLPQLDHVDTGKICIVDQMDAIMKFCIQLLHNTLSEACFGWNDVMTFRIYIRTSLHISHATLSPIFTRVFNEFAQLNTNLKTTGDPIFNIIPVLGSGRSAGSVDDILSCEIFARKT